MRLGISKHGEGLVLLVYHSANGPQIVLQFGNGLIGGAISQALCTARDWHMQECIFTWPQQEESVRRECITELSELLKSLQQQCRRSIHIVWSAGKCGFNAEEEQTDAEFAVFQQSVTWLLESLSPFDLPIHFHLFSSAGGLFEGIRHIDRDTLPVPKRPYGYLKQRQEEFVLNAKGMFSSIYRPTSVYATVQPGKRRGLIPTLMENGLKNQTSLIYGEPTTLRDYIWAEDIGRFLAKRILHEPATHPHSAFLLATAVPTSIHQVIQVIESLLMKPLAYAFRQTAEANSLDITVVGRAIPQGLQVTHLKTAIQKIYTRLLQGGLPAYGS